ncbi:TetR family transcriptional regulator [Paenibacillus campinasensis]|uniref:TetR family transcriptional regulator n=1 Tax=Paenibacillus campinasensis TaxID=66347 RepID=A0ABW9T3R2_9BACL|nr:TetR/AcrR family transcriptional regulator [Paenibacillus campinasensis]MUG65856.1 TetR family transcriptional regulator [Paenibacillus campinasensis]
MNTKSRIVQTAVQLFNEQGIGKVSTNHIAAAASMSPGNLYYHFKNKSEIIQAILLDMYEEWNEVWSLPEHVTLTQQHLEQKLLMNFDILWRYRFFYREALSLFQADEALRLLHTEMMNTRLVEQEAFIRRFITDGVLRIEADSEQLQKLLIACWIIANNWLSFLEMNGQPVDEASFTNGVGLIWAILDPYLVK